MLIISMAIAVLFMMCRIFARWVKLQCFPREYEDLASELLLHHIFSCLEKLPCCLPMLYSPLLILRMDLLTLSPSQCTPPLSASSFTDFSTQSSSQPYTTLWPSSPPYQWSSHIPFLTTIVCILLFYQVQFLS